MSEEKLKAALMHAGLQNAEYLGEGAWHHAWKVVKNNTELVLRIPKEKAYGKAVPFNEEALKAEYAGTQLYYQLVNKAVQGAAPNFFEYHVSPNVTYTVEAFGGHQIDLYDMTEEIAFQTGKEVGEIHRKVEEVPHGINGFGYLAWSKEKGLQGTFFGDVHEFLNEECEEQLADYQYICTHWPEFYDEKIFDALQLAGNLRKRSFTKPLLANQDVSPENILLHGNRICLIDPYPSVYYSRGMAGNFMNLYETYFIALADTERYRKHRFKGCSHNLKMMAKGFLAGYSRGESKVVSEVRGEQLLQLLETVFSHVKLLSEELPVEMEIRYGNKHAIEKRLPMLAEELTNFAAAHIHELAVDQVSK